MKKVIVLTGASSGIGRATAMAFSQSPHMLVLLSRNEEKLQEIAESLECPTLVVPCDVTDAEQVSHSMQKVVDTFGGIDVLINNAGLGFFDPLEKGKLEQWHTMVDVNIKGILNCFHACLPSLLQSEDGQIINVTSVASHQVFQNSGVYSATKHAVLALSKSFHLEFANQLKVTSISPGAVNTPFVEGTTNDEMIDDLRKYFEGGLDPNVIAEQIVHCVEQPKNVTVSEIIVRPKR